MIFFSFLQYNMEGNEAYQQAMGTHGMVNAPELQSDEEDERNDDENVK